jgi:hypothetical protein
MLQWNPVYTGVIRRTRLVMLVARAEGAGDSGQRSADVEAVVEAAGMADVPMITEPFKRPF